MVEHVLGPWLSFAAGLLGVVATVLFLLVRARFRGGLLAKGFGLLVLAMFLWALSMLQAGAMALFFPWHHAALLHHGLMTAGLVTAVGATYAFFVATSERPRLS